MFAAAPSQNETLEALCADSGIEWSRVNAFHMDEYVGLDASHPAGFRNFLRRAIFERFPFKKLYLLDGNAIDPEKAAEEYEESLRAHPLDICLMGVGENGHIAFNDPPVADFNDPKLVKVVELDLPCRQQQVNDGCFKTIEDVPTHALTATIPALLGAARLFCSVPGKTKATAIRAMLEGEISSECPASVLRRHTGASLYLDKDSAEYIR
ncbi:MAG: glucosamine-6-phosphate deaminase [Clostridiaceae bacterium]|nr:glucosamine-6-phosphate deaminase [Clostridiaceae bacterium]